VTVSACSAHPVSRWPLTSAPGSVENPGAMDSRIAKVVVDIALDREFDYLIPRILFNTVKVGCRVLVPFGGSRRRGYVVGITDQTSQPRLKEILAVLDSSPILTPISLALAKWVSSYYCATIEHALRAVLPAAVRAEKGRFKSRMVVRLSPSVMQDGRAASAGVRLTARQESLIAILREKGGSASLAELSAASGASAAVARSLEKKGVVTIEGAVESRNPVAVRQIVRTDPLALTEEQAAALEIIKQSMDMDREGEGKGTVADRRGRVTLLFGVTGSGKTEVYLQAIEHGLKRGRGAIVLVPEIALTPQTVERFVSRFGNRVAVLHSHLSEGERYDEWHRVRRGDADIVVGARSAVFAPVRNLGLIVVDEEHEPSYKQEEPPRYHARDVAVMRGAMEGCAVVLGSATPSLESWKNALTGKYRLAKLSKRVDGRQMPRVAVVDMRIGSLRGDRGGVFSKDLLEAVRSRLERAEQVILFLNRRGYASSLICSRCGHVEKCEKCSVTYTYHIHGGMLICHMCGTAKKAPVCCPACRDPDFKYRGAGTQRVEEILGKCFPAARIQRLDSDVTGRKDSYERILGEFRCGRTHILVGTQMIAKGLHFPNVTLVGVVCADVGLHMPDFRAGERTFQLLAQVAGRAGRGDVPGEVMIQTFTPHHEAVQAARGPEYERFADQELEFRKELFYPPFAHLVCVTVHGPREDAVRDFAAKVRARVAERAAGCVRISESAPAPISKVKGRFRYQIMLRARRTAEITEPLRQALGELRKPKGIACVVDVDAIDLM